MAFSELIKGGIEGLSSGLDKLFTSDDERLSKQVLLDRIAQNPQQWTIETNKLDAQSGKFFQGGWRPAIGWVCAVSLACFFIPQFIIGSFLWAKITLQTSHFSPYPVSAAELMSLVASMLGMAAIRSVEVIKGVRK